MGTTRREYVSFRSCLNNPLSISSTEFSCFLSFSRTFQGPASFICLCILSVCFCFRLPASRLPILRELLLAASLLSSSVSCMPCIVETRLSYTRPTRRSRSQRENTIGHCMTKETGDLIDRFAFLVAGQCLLEGRESAYVCQLVSLSIGT